MRTCGVLPTRAARCLGALEAEQLAASRCEYPVHRELVVLPHARRCELAVTGRHRLDYARVRVVARRQRQLDFGEREGVGLQFGATLADL